MDDHSIKKTKKLEILHQKNDHISKKINMLENHNQQLKQNYSSRMIEKYLTTEQVSDKVRQLEQFEMSLIERLKNTHSKQQIAYKELESIVHQGYDYYLNSFKEKRDKESLLYSNGNILKSRNDSTGAAS